MTYITVFLPLMVCSPMHYSLFILLERKLSFFSTNLVASNMLTLFLLLLFFDAYVCYPFTWFYTVSSKDNSGFTDLLMCVIRLLGSTLYPAKITVDLLIC